ncbi:hypothetical protein [Agrobacterium arsenijevicii]|uniref:Uncharacterized protein n=1 Tax=Agrobacterium arsenijevicii TaxID=1585697 RepID=A0ABR5CZS5_9HYPH|nr:hypothetical protein RP75_27535 [Agrobacterium arsenijevicii]
MPILANEKQFQRRVIFLIASIVAGLILTTIATVLCLADHQNWNALRRQGTLAAGVIAVQREELEKVTDVYASWDEAFVMSCQVQT